MEILEKLKQSIIDMENEQVIAITKKALEQGISPEKMLYEALTPAMDIVGQNFENGEIFIPEMLMSAQAMKGALDILNPILSKSGVASQGKVVIGTVAGDIHNIGQEIVAMMLVGAGFEVVNLGIDVPNEKFVEKAKEIGADVVGMSAFLSTTGLRYADVIEELKKAGLRDKVKVIIGGAAASDKYAETIGADGFGANASTAVKLVKSLLKK